MQEGDIENQRSCFYAFCYLVPVGELWFPLVLGKGFMLTFLTGLTISQDSEIIQKLCYLKDLRKHREESKKGKSNPQPKALLFPIEKLPTVPCSSWRLALPSRKELISPQNV